ncbi:EpsG family protein [Citrobacter portucalensis]|uniref:EpsG family protein n=1 Tax=Citrobacter portucalensis TaxID=1639133 RepID=UPI003075C2D8
MYNFIILLPFFIVVLSCCNKNFNKILAPAILLIIGTIVSLRDISVDRDSFVYFTVYGELIKLNDLNEILIYSTNLGQEPGFLILMKFFSSLGFSFFSFRAIFEMLTLYSLFFFIKRICDTNFFLITLLIYIAMFILFRDFTQIRFSFSSCMALNSIYYRLKNRNTLSILFLIFGILVHNAILIIIPILLCANCKFIYNLKFYVSAIFFAILLFKFDFFMSLINTGLLPHQITRYIGQDEAVGNTFGITMLMTTALSFIMCVAFRPDYGADYKLLYINMFLATIVSFIFMNIPIMMRMQLLCFTAIIILPNVISRYWVKRNIANIMLIQLSFATFSIIYFYSILSSEIVYEYKSIL